MATTNWPHFAKALLVASPGGHVNQITRLADRHLFADDLAWLTADSAQTRSLLADRRVHYIPYIGSRDYGRFARSLWRVYKVVRKERPDVVISTGAAIALSAFFSARLLQIPCIYIESVSRTDGPSMTGRLVKFLRLASTYTQHSRWASDDWRVFPSVLEAYEPHPSGRDLGPSESAPPGGLAIFVTLGTIRPYRFDSLVDAVLRSGLASDRTVWQLGCTTRADLPGKVFTLMGVNEFAGAVQAADVVITHAGVGSILDLLDAGCFPVVVPRRRSRGEHVDDHQGQISCLMEARGLGIVREAPSLSSVDIVNASRCRIRPARRSG